ncbi:MAG: sodium:calcium antiporter [Sphaerotilus natans subsp. sulfidivorans]|uniref:sodium:calcium antiporter n=1 Tax=Sphaerotilus sulfidivorans TaxID=639200 RepID=UPI0023558A72|nr:sodium:calcium antiporter [Sphaerotilus sulfidivorans]MCK6400707.1 sodium:calcium antiporter [Sphaerotilus sulfidivorans]
MSPTLALQFLLCAAVIMVAGVTLSRSADRLAELHGWGRGWVGLALLATVTSLPELASGISAVTTVQAPDLAVGNALGACVVNLGFLAVVDLLHRQAPMYRQAGSTHLLSAGFGVLMLALVAVSQALGERVPVLWHAGLNSPVLLLLYLLALRSVFEHERGQAQTQVRGRGRAGTADPAAHASDPPGRRTVGQEWMRFGMAALAVLAAGSWLPVAADAMASASGLSRSAVGTVFMAVVTTLPEMAVTLGALRLGAVDMAIGNLLGSNLFNLAILGIDDLLFTGGPLLAVASPLHAGTAAVALMMTGLVIIGLVMRPRARVLDAASWVSAGLVAAGGLHALLLLSGA